MGPETEGIFRSSGKVVNPAAGLSILTGAVGAICSLLLWLYSYRPDTSIFGQWGREIAANGILAEQLKAIAVTTGIIAVVASVLASFGGRGRWTTATGISLGVVAFSYPVLTWINDITSNIGSPLG